MDGVGQLDKARRLAAFAPDRQARRLATFFHSRGVGRTLGRWLFCLFSPPFFLSFFSLPLFFHITAFP